MKSEVELEYVKCGLCGQDKTQLIYIERGFNIVECVYCGLVYVNPRFSYNLYRSKTNLNYRELVSETLEVSGQQKSLNKNVNDIDRDFYIKSRLKEAISNLNRIERFGKKLGKLLDVGCGEGFFLKAAKDRGWEVTGIEISLNHQPLPEYKLNIVNEDILKAVLEENSFDVITFYDVLEHLPYPSEAINKAMSLLKKGGLLVIRVPNERFLRIKMEIISTFLGRDFYLKNNNFSIMGYYAPETHLYNFNRETLKVLLQNKGFNILKICLGKFAVGNGKVRFLIHYFIYYLTKLIYCLSAGKLSYNCSIIVFARK